MSKHTPPTPDTTEINKHTDLYVNHVPESLQVVTRRLASSRPELTVVDQTTELAEALRNQQLRLARRRADLTRHCKRT